MSDDARAQPFTEDQVVLCRRWIALHARERITPNPRAFPYHLKHEVERWQGPGHLYIPESAFLEAAMRAGFELKLGCYRMALRPRSRGVLDYGPTKRIPWEALQ